MIFCPMLQLGCFSACSSVACSMSAGAQVRNGPPDAVMMTRASSSRLPEASAWNSALCSESAGRMQAPAFLARSMKNVAGADQALLVGERDGGAAIDRGKRRLQSGRAADRRHHPIRRPRGRLR